MIGFLTGCIVGLAAGIVVMAILYGWFDRRKKKRDFGNLYIQRGKKSR